MALLAALLLAAAGAGQDRVTPETVLLERGAWRGSNSPEPTARFTTSIAADCLFSPVTGTHPSR